MSIFAAVAVLLAISASSAHALGIETFSALPDDTTAAAHSDFTTTFDLTEEPTGVPGNQTDDIRNLKLDLPTGLLPNPSNPVKCAIADFQDDNCPTTSEVGSTTLLAFAFVGIEVPIPVFGTVYNLQPQPTEPARLGIIVRPVAILGAPLGKIFLQAPIRVRDEDDYGLEATVADIPRKLSFIDIRIKTLSLTINAAANNTYFESNPTSCEPATTRLSIEDYNGVKDSATSTWTPTNCGAVPFQPDLRVTSSDRRTDAASQLDVQVGQPRDIGAKVTSQISKVVVNTGPGYALNPVVAPGLGVCTDAQFGPEGDPNENCPANSRIGSVVLSSPLIGDVPGTLFFSQNAQNRYRLFVLAYKAGVAVRLKATVEPDPQTGDLTATFADIPQQPFTNFKLTFNGPPTSVTSTPPDCGPSQSRAAQTPRSGNPTQTPTATETFSTDGKGACNYVLNASAAAATNTKAAKADTSLALDIGRQERDRSPQDLDVKLPQGFLGRIFSVPFCPDAAIASGACPESSKVGTLTAAIGSGPDTAQLPGSVYLAGSTQSDLARLVLVIPAKLGPIDLGTFVQVANLNIGELDKRVRVTTKLPKVFNGIPIRLRRLQLGVDKPGFLFNPTGCDVRNFDVALGTDPSLTSVASTSYQATNCDRLSFTPSLDLTVPDTASRLPGDLAPLQVGLGGLSSATSSNIKRVQLVVPRALRAETSVLTKVCQAKELAAETCPETTRIGTAYARTPLLPYPLEGPVYIAQTGKTPVPRAPLMLPYAVAFLQGGPVRIRIDGSLALSTDGGRLDGLFEGLPDVPLDEFRLNFDKRNFRTFSDLCSTTRGPADAELDGQSGAQTATQAPVKPDACGERAAVRMSARGLSRPQPTARLSLVRNPRAGKLTGINVALPKQLRATGSKKRVMVTADGRKVSRKRVSISRRGRVSVRVPSSRAAERISVSFKRGSLRSTTKIRRRAKRDLRKDKAASLRLSVTGSGTDSGTRRPSLTVRFDALARP